MESSGAMRHWILFFDCIFRINDYKNMDNGILFLNLKRFIGNEKSKHIRR